MMSKTQWKKRLKHMLGQVTYGLGLHRRLLGDRGIIALFHRVDDDLQGNPISCTSAEFTEFCLFFRRYFQVVSLTQFLDDLEAGRPLGGKLAITFDDGYRDNLLTAAPILERLELPASFFITTGLMGTQTVPWWDEEWGIQSQWMSWDEVRDLARRGFELGAHTVTHPDLGELEGPEAVLEIRESRSRLEEEVGTPVTMFAYPFGRPHQITEGNRDVVRSLGFRCCLSAHGGLVDPGTDPFRLRRSPISPWHLSPYQFGWEILREP